jgi:hypothetical protein
LSNRISPSTVELLQRPDAYIRVHQALDDEELREALRFFKNLAEMLLSLGHFYEMAFQATLNTLGLLESSAQRRGWRRNIQRANGVMYYVGD